MRLRGYLLLAAALLLACPASARVHYGGGHIGPGHRLQSGAPPLEGLSASLSEAYSLRRLRSGYTGPGIRLRRASDNLEADINFLGFTGFTGAPIDTAAAGAHCAATTCFLRTWYEQLNAQHLQQATPANQPAYIANCGNGLPCIRTTSATQTMATVASYAAASTLATLNVVANRAAGTAVGCQVRQNGNTGNGIVTNSAANQWLLLSNGSMSVAAADGAWHSAIGVFNGAATVYSIDGTETVGSVLGQALTGQVLFNGAGGNTCDFAEYVIWDNYVMPPAERAALTNNQRGFWGF